MEDGKTKELQLSEKEKRLIQVVRQLSFGQILIHVADGQPVRLEEVRKSIKL